MNGHPYDEIYLTQVVETQGKFFEELQDIEPPIDSQKTIEDYMRSNLRRQLDEGHAFFLTMDATNLRKRLFLEPGKAPRPGEPLRGFLPNWIGRFYGYCQWYWNVSSEQVVEKLPVTDMTSLYRGAHDLDLAVAVRKIGAPLFGDVSKPV